MNSLVKTSKLATSWLKHGSPAITAVRSHWNKDYKPAPYPITEEQRIAAAKKYNVHVREYEPYPDDGDGAGDYPKLPVESIESRDPFYPWDNPDLRRNFQETLHEDYDYFRDDRYDANKKFHQPLWVQWLQFLGTLAGFTFLIVATDGFKMFLAAIPPELPKEGKVHYTFEKPE